MIALPYFDTLLNGKLMAYLIEDALVEIVNSKLELRKFEDT